MREITSVVLHFDYVLLIDCLPADDEGGTRRLFEDLEAFSSTNGFPAPERRKARSASELLTVLADVERVAAESGSLPMIQIDAHGSEEVGLEFRQGSAAPSRWLRWEELAKALGRINRHTRNRLAVLSCVCFGYHMNRGIDLKSPAPYSFGIAPDKSVTLKQLELILPRFYEALLLHQDFLVAVDALDGDLSVFSSRTFVRRVLVEMARFTYGAKGRRRREDLLTEARMQAAVRRMPKSQVRQRIKRGILLTDLQIKQQTAIFLCGEPAPFSAAEVMAEARGDSN